jgi:hypothetical protein
MYAFGAVFGTLVVCFEPLTAFVLALATAVVLAKL